MKKIILSFIALAAIGVTIYLFTHRDKEDIVVSPGQLISLETMAELCTTEIYAEVPVRDTINNKVIFAIQKQRGQITFDLDQLTIDPTADTICVILPRPRILLNESTEPNSWEVIDTKAIGRNALFRSDKFTVEEENAAKARAKQKTIARLRQNGTIRQAQEEAALTLETFLSTVYRKPIHIVQKE